MSSGQTPVNPGTPRHNPHAPRPSMLARIGPGKIAAGSALAIASYLYLSKPPAPREGSPITLRTPGVKNIEKAYTNSGATPTHTKAYGGTTLGDKESVYLKEGGATGAPSKQSPHDKEGMGNEQRPSATSNVSEAFNESMTGSPKGK